MCGPNVSMGSADWMEYAQVKTRLQRMKIQLSLLGTTRSIKPAITTFRSSGPRREVGIFVVI